MSLQLAKDQAARGEKSFAMAVATEILKSGLKQTGGAFVNHAAKGLAAYLSFKDQPYAQDLVLMQIKGELDLNILWSVLAGIGIDLLDIIPKVESSMGFKFGKIPTKK